MKAQEPLNAILTIVMLDAAGYTDIKENPEGRITFWDAGREVGLQFWYTGKTLDQLMKFIQDLAHSNGYATGVWKMRSEIKQVLGID